MFWQSLAISALIWPLCWALCGRLCWALLMCWPIAMWLPLELWLRIAHSTSISAHIVALVAETNWMEGENFASSYGTPLLLGWVLWMLLYAAGFWAARQHQLRWTHASRRWLLALTLPLLTLWAVQATPSPPVQQPSMEDLLKDSSIPTWGSELATVFPSNIAVALAHYQQQSTQLQTLRTQLRNQVLHARASNTDAAEIVVLIIGESASATRWSMLGYERETTPLLQNMPGLLAFSNVLALSPATRNAIPGAIAHRPVLQPTGKIDLQGTPSIVQAFREAGYQTHWISNQAPLGMHDSALSLYAQEAHSVRFLNPGTYDQRTSHDDVLLPALTHALETPGKQFVVLHLMGSHFDYALRYPPAFDYFQPSSQARALPSPAQVNNSYDNSIRYTDFILASAIEIVAQRSQRAAVLYFSDHGVDPATGPCSSGSAGRHSEATYRVPVAIWLGSAQQQQTPDLWQQLKRNQHLPYTTRAAYGSLLQLGGIDTSEPPNTGTFLDTPAPEMPRWVAGNGGRLVNFEQARRLGSCRISSG